jgi:glutamate dehydrogenase
MGPVFPRRAEQDTGYPITAIARSYEIARDITAARSIWASIEALDTRIPADIQYAMMFEVSRKLRHACYWLLKTHDGQFDDDLVVSTREPLLDVLKRLPEVLSKAGQQHLDGMRRQHARMGVPARLAAEVSALTYVADALEIVRLARLHHCDTTTIAEIYFRIGQRLQLEWLRTEIDRLEVDGRWQARARGTLRDNAVRAQRELTSRVRSLTSCTVSEDAIDELLASDAAAFDRVQTLVSQMKEGGGTDFATLTVAIDEFNKLTKAD